MWSVRKRCVAGDLPPIFKIMAGHLKTSTLVWPPPMVFPVMHPVIGRCLFRPRVFDQAGRAFFDVSDPGLGSPLIPTSATSSSLPLDLVRYRTDEIHDRAKSYRVGIPRSSCRNSYAKEVYLTGFRFSFGRLRPRFAYVVTAGNRPPDRCETRQNWKQTLSCVIPNNRQMIFTMNRSQMT